jgi:hypothetical protein
MKRLFILSIAALSMNVMEGHPAQDKVVAKYKKAFEASKGVISSKAEVPVTKQSQGGSKLSQINSSE